MLDALKSHRAYKPCHEWIGEVPSHWDVVPGFAAFREKQIKNTGMAVPDVLSLSYGRIVVKPPEKLHGLVPASFETYQIVDPGDIIIRPTDLQNDWHSIRVGLAKNRGIITSAYMCLKPTALYTPEYLHSLLLSYDMLKFFYGMGSGLRQSLDYKDLKRFPMLVPPPAEQAGIVRFLGAVDRKVNRFIRAKRRLIEVLTEQKQAIITHAVTRGLNPHAPIKPSGIDWLGDVPKHWEVRRLRTLVSRIDQGVSPQAENRLADAEGTWGVLKSGCVNRGRFRATEHKRLPDGFVIDTSLRVAAGDVLVSRACGSPDLVGSVAQVTPCPYQLILSDKTFRPVFKESKHVAFLVYAMNSSVFRRQVRLAISGAEGLANNLPLSSLRDFVLPLPPPDEAELIAQGLSEILAESTTAITLAEREIDLIREYRTRLVADVVTGKVDVRAAAAALPADEETVTPEVMERGADGVEDDDDPAAEAIEETADVAD
ncbi:MAG: restriction endonuclease subunit S [Armatimonadetes bacterium]|nr:restriction endonuclease subunit S [Armatimonadota bacterium]